MKQIVVGPDLVQILIEKLFHEGLCSIFIHDHSQKSEGGICVSHAQKGVQIENVQFVDKPKYEEK